MEEREPITQENFSEDLEELFPGSALKRNDTDYSFRYDLSYDIKLRYRYLRKQISALIRERLKNRFKQVLFVTLGEIPYDYVSAFRKQYPDKELKVLVPILGESKRLIKTPFKFKYYLQNKTNEAQIYKFPRTNDNITVYGIYSETFSNIESVEDFGDIKYLSPFIKCARIFGRIMRPDVIHSDLVPFYLGAEFEKKSVYPSKVFQTIQDLTLRNLCFEPFWAFLNMADKSSMKKLCKDKIVKKCIATLFDQQNADKFRHLKECIDFVYMNYINFRKEIDKSEDLAENTLFERLNERVLKLFPEMQTPDQKTYNPMYNGIKRADFWAVLSKSYFKEISEHPETVSGMTQRIKENLSKGGFVHKPYIQKTVKIHRTFDAENFRDRRYKNKEYLTKELSKDRINMGFVDKTFFEGESEIHGYLDSFYDAPLIFGKFSTNILEDGFDIAVAGILKLFELNKNIRVIINIPHGMKNSYIKSFVDFCENSPAINGRWIFIDGKINLPQFLSASDIILLPSRINGDGQLPQEAINYGCIPVVSRYGIYNDIIIDIFDNLLGYGFKTELGLNMLSNPELLYTKTITKALNFYFQNGSWNLMIKNGLTSNTGWDFETLAQYNKIYDDMI